MLDLSFTLYSKDKQNDWHFVRITWNAATDTFTWRNRAGAKWGLTPIPKGEDDWVTDRLEVGPECPYYNSTRPHRYAGVEWEGEAGFSEVSRILGPWEEAYLKQETCGSGPRVADVSADDKLVVMNKVNKVHEFQQDSFEEMID